MKGGRCAICGRPTKNYVMDPDSGLKLFICPRHVRSEEEAERILRELGGKPLDAYVPSRPERKEVEEIDGDRCPRCSAPLELVYGLETRGYVHRLLMRCPICSRAYVVRLPYPRKRGELRGLRMRSWEKFRLRNRVVRWR